MVSVIICSRHINLSELLRDNIYNTIGVPCEVITVDNSANKYSIFEAYNLGIEKTQYGILCFVHEDVKFISQDWGKILINQFNSDSKVGIIGVAGSTQKTKAPSAWWVNKGIYPTNIIERLPGKEPFHIVKGWCSNETFKEVVVVDGVFIAARKMEGTRFNTLIPGFHNYDQSLCIDYINKGYKVYVTKEILLEHYSAGKIDYNWILPTHIFHKLYEKSLPASVKSTISLDIEIDNYIKFIIICYDYKFKSIAIYYWLKLIRMKPISKYHLIFLKRLFFK